MSYFDDNENYIVNRVGTPLPKKSKLKSPNKEESKSPKPSLFVRGYSPVREKLLKKSRFTMSCYNCGYYYQAVGDKEEVCQNPDVLKYDMVVTDNNIYCNRWAITPREQSVKSLFKNR